MSDETKTVLLKVEIDQQKALATLQDTNAKISGLKNQVSELNKEYKQGKLTQEQYARAKTDLDLKIQQETKSRNILQQAVQAENNSLGAQKALLADLKAQRDKVDQSTVGGAQKAQALTERIKGLNDSLMKTNKESGGLTESFLKFAEGAKVGEFELGKVAGLLPLIANPATAAAAAITGLGAAYADSAVGAKDLEEAQNVLKAQWQVFSGELGGSNTGEKGIFTKFAEGLTSFTTYVKNVFTNIDSTVDEVHEKSKKQEETIKEVAESYNKIKELQFEQLQNQIKAEEQRKEAFEATEQRANATTLEGRVEAARKVVELQKESVEGSVEALKKQAEILKTIGNLTHNNIEDEKNVSAFRQQYLQLLIQIKSEESARQRRISSAVIEEQKLTKELEKQNREEAFNAAKSKDTIDINEPKKDFDRQQSKNNESARLNIQKFENDLLKKGYDEDKENYKTYLENKARIEKDKEIDHEELVKKRIKTDQSLMQAQKGFLDLARVTLGQNSEEYKAFATTQAIAATYLAADKVLAADAEFFPANIGAAAGIIADGLANVIQINKAAGGGTFETKGPTMLLVGDNPGGRERIDVTPLSGKGETTINPSGNLIAMAGGGSLYASGGGLVSSEMSNNINSEVSLTNAFKNMPAPIVSWKEGLIVGNRIKVKEKLTSA